MKESKEADEEEEEKDKWFSSNRAQSHEFMILRRTGQVKYLKWDSNICVHLPNGTIPNEGKRKKK